MLDYQPRVWCDPAHVTPRNIHYAPPPPPPMPTHHHVRHLSRTSTTSTMSTATPSPAILAATVSNAAAAAARRSSACCSPRRRSSNNPHHQDFQWLSELQTHIADAEYLKPLLYERRLELQKRQAELNFLTREIHDRQKQVRDSNFFASGLQRRELQIHLQTLLRDREVARRELQTQQADFDRLSGQVQSHKENIDCLMKRLRIIVSS